MFSGASAVVAGRPLMLTAAYSCPVDSRGPIPHDTLTDAVWGLSAWGAGHSGGGAMANTWASLRFASLGVSGRLTKTAHPEVAAVTVSNNNGRSNFRVSMAAENNRNAPGGANRVACRP